MNLKTGMYHLLTVERDSDFGYFLSNGEDDVLLHSSEMNDQIINIGDEVNVFLYNDHKGRVSATLYQPKLVINDIAFLEVEDFQPKMGFFLANGLKKQVLIPISELPEDKSIWPNTNDQLLVTLDHDKQDRLLARLVKEDDEINEYISKQEELNGNIKEIDKTQFLDGIVIRHLSVGTHLYLENNKIGFIHRSEQEKELRLGQKVSVRISYIRDDGRLNLTMKQLKEKSRIEDADKILEILRDRDGAMPYWDKTPADIILIKFKLSKSAFKRALGKLMKEGIVYQEEGWTYLKKS